MRLFHLAGCLMRAVKIIPVAAITGALITFGLVQSGGQLFAMLETTTGRLFMYGFAAIFLLSLLGSLGKRRRELGCVVLLAAIAPFLLLGAVTASTASALTVAGLGLGPGAESGSLLARFWAALTEFPSPVQVSTIVGAFLGFVGLAGEVKYGSSED